MENNEKPCREYSLKRIFRKLMLVIQASPCIPGSVRPLLVKWGGVKVGKDCFIGADVLFDGLRPDLISIGERCTVTTGTKIITHYYNAVDGSYNYGKVRIGYGCFIGMNTLIVNSVSIGDNSVIGAGSVVTRDIPGNEIWAGNPARFIKHRNKIKL